MPVDGTQLDFLPSSTNHADREHALLSGSIAHRWSQCPSSVALTRTLPPQEPGEPAKRGQFLHEVCEKALRTFLNFKVAGEGSPDSWEKEYEDNEEALETGRLWIKTIWEEVLEQSLTGKAWGLEEKVTLSQELSMWGIVDAWFVYINDKGQRVLHIVDFKSGFHIVPIEKNMQLLFYAAAFREELLRQGKDIDIVKIGIVQPKLAS